MVEFYHCRQDVEAAKKELKRAVNAVLRKCKKKHGFIPEPIWWDEDQEYIFGRGEDDVDASVLGYLDLPVEDSCDFLWEHGVDASVLGYLDLPVDDDPTA